MKTIWDNILLSQYMSYMCLSIAPAVTVINITSKNKLFKIGL